MSLCVIKCERLISNSWLKAEEISAEKHHYHFQWEHFLEITVEIALRDFDLFMMNHY